MSLPTLVNNIRQKTVNQWMERWNDSEKGRDFYSVQPKRNTCRYKTLTRRQQVQISRLKFHHFPCQKYLHRFNLAGDSVCTLCNEEDETVEHIILKCTALESARTFRTTENLTEALGNRDNQWSTIDNIIMERGVQIRTRARDAGGMDQHQ